MFDLDAVCMFFGIYAQFAYFVESVHKEREQTLSTDKVAPVPAVRAT